MIVCRCNACGNWIGKEAELRDHGSCPNCGRSDGIMDLESGCVFDDRELEILWSILGDIPCNDDDESEEDFIGFEAGTNRFDIWHWFDEKYSKGVAVLSGVI